MIYQLLLVALFAMNVVQGIPSGNHKEIEELQKDENAFAEKFRGDSVKLALKMGDSKKVERASKMDPVNFAQECLKAHNEYRKKHGVGNLALSKELNAFAQEWANHLAATDSVKHSPDEKYGENIYRKGSTDPNFTITGKDPVDSWYSEIKDFKFGKDPSDEDDTGHFTQVVWKGSKSVGCAFAKSKSNKIVVVANYDPPGNYDGEYTENVPHPKK